MIKLKKSIHFIKKVGDGIYDFVDKYNNNTLYLFDFNDVKTEYDKVLKIYNNKADAINLEDFSKNYAFGYYMQKGLLDYQFDAHKMSDEIYEYLMDLKKQKKI